MHIKAGVGVKIGDSALRWSLCFLFAWFCCCGPITLLTPEIIVWLFRCAYWRIHETERCADLMMLLAGVGAFPRCGWPDRGDWLRWTLVLCDCDWEVGSVIVISTTRSCSLF